VRSVSGDWASSIGRCKCSDFSHERGDPLISLRKRGSNVGYVEVLRAARVPGREDGHSLLAFAPLDHAIEPRLLDDPVVASIT
jgi:hypothetical protein